MFRHLIDWEKEAQPGKGGAIYQESKRYGKTVRLVQMNYKIAELEETVFELLACFVSRTNSSVVFKYIHKTVILVVHFQMKVWFLTQFFFTKL